MPELPEVETTVRGLEPVLLGQRIMRVDVRRADLRRPFPVDLVQRMTGAVVTNLSRRAKYGLIGTDRGATMIFHLGMAGRWRIDVPDSNGPHDHLLLEVANGRTAVLHDPRRFGSVDLVDGDPEHSFAPFLALGPEPLSARFDASYLKQALAGRSAAIKLLLLDQRIVAGLGNIYVCEALFMAGIAPTRPASSISKPRLERLVDAIRQVLIAAIAAGGSSLRDFARPDGELGYFAKDWQVYGREGQPCRTCARPIRRRFDGGRSTFYCPHCQK